MPGAARPPWPRAGAAGAAGALPPVAAAGAASADILGMGESDVGATPGSAGGDRAAELFLGRAVLWRYLGQGPALPLDFPPVTCAGLRTENLPSLPPSLPPVAEWEWNNLGWERGDPSEIPRHARDPLWGRSRISSAEPLVSAGSDSEGAFGCGPAPAPGPGSRRVIKNAPCLFVQTWLSSGPELS